MTHTRTGERYLATAARAALIVVLAIFATGRLSGQTAFAVPSLATPYADAKPVFDALQESLWPSEFRGKDDVSREAEWPAWLTRADAIIRSRVQAGDDDSIINLLMFGSTFTRQPRITEHELGGIVVRQANGTTAFVPSPVLKVRIDDFVAALASPGTNERLQLARRVIDRNGIDPSSDAGKARLRRYLEDRVALVGSAAYSSTLVDPNAQLVDQVTLFRDRGLSSDTSISIDFGIDRTLAEIAAAGLLQPRTVRHVAIVGPGLDFTDKQEGHDFYPLQTIQPFAVLDSLARSGLAAADAQVTAFDLSERVLQHIEAARSRARDGRTYQLVLPRELDRFWTPELTKYWEQFGDRIGKPTTTAPPPPSAGRVTTRGVLVAPSVVLSVLPRDLNIVAQRVATPRQNEQYDLIVATNILLYYDVFEQSVAIANVAGMLRPGGIFLTNDRIFELPSSPIRSAGATTVTYQQSSDARKGDRIAWYVRQ